MDGNTKITDLLEDDVAIEHKAHEDGAIDKDFYDKIKSWTQHELNDLENRFYSRPWFGKAWQEYRSHVLNAEQKNIRNPGYIFRKYIADDKDIPAEQKEHTYLSEDYMWYELRTEKERMCDCAHSIEEGKDYIEHHGIIGQRKGVRRFQNEDGTLTPEGRIRYGKQVSDIVKNNTVKETQEVYKPNKQGVLELQKETVTKQLISEKEATEYVIKQERAKQISAEVKGTQDIANGVKAVADQTADLFPQQSGKKVHGSYPDLSDQELQKRINRMRLEQNYSDLKGDTKYIKSGQDKTREALQTIGAVAGIAGTIIGIAGVVYGMKHPSGGGKKGG